MDGLQYILRCLALQAIHVFCQLRFEVGCLVLVYHVVLGKFVKHGNNFRILLSGCFLVGSSTQFLHGAPCGPCEILIFCTLCLSLPDPLLR